MTKEGPKVSRLTADAIPEDLPSVLGWKEIPIRENNEPLVALGPFSDFDDIFTDSIYFGERIDSPYLPNPTEGSLITMFVRKSVADELRNAQSLLPQGMYLIIFDAYRTVSAQQSLFDGYYQALKEQNPTWDKERLRAETERYVSLPSTDPEKPSPHNTGGAVDLAIFHLSSDIDQRVKLINERLAKPRVSWQDQYPLMMGKFTIIRKNAKLLNFGTAFDFGGEKSALNYFENLAKRPWALERRAIRKNRRLLYGIMTSAGFEPYPDEWWHYNSKKTQMGAKTTGLNHAEYGAIDLSAENREHEGMRQGHHLGSLRINEGWTLIGKTNPLEEHFRVVKASVLETGDIRVTSLPEAALIKPTRK